MAATGVTPVSRAKVDDTRRALEESRELLIDSNKRNRELAALRADGADPSALFGSHVSPGSAAAPPADPDATMRQVLVVVLGASGVGKTSLVLGALQPVRRRRARVLETSLREAVGAGGARVLLHLQDLDGDERVRRETVIDERLLPRAQAALVVYDVTSARSFARARDELASFRANARTRAAVALAANKCDCEPAARAVAAREGRALADEFAATFFEVSATERGAIEPMLQALADGVAPAPSAPESAGEGTNPRPFTRLTPRKEPGVRVRRSTRGEALERLVAEGRKRWAVALRGEDFWLELAMYAVCLGAMALLARAS